KLVGKVIEILKQGNPDSQAVLLPLLATLTQRSPWHEQPDVQATLRSLLEQSPQPGNYAQVLDAASSFPTLIHDPKVQELVLASLNSYDRDVQRAAMRVSFDHLLDDSQTLPAVKTAFAKLNASALRVLMEEAGNPQFLKRHFGISGGAVSQDQDFLNGHRGALKIKEPLEYPVVVDTVLASLLNPDANVSAAALDTLRKVKGVELRPDFKAAMNQLQNSTNPRLKLFSTSVLKGKSLSDALEDVQPGSILDYRY